MGKRANRRKKKEIRNIKDRLKKIEKVIPVKNLDRQVTLAGSQPIPLTTGGGWACHSVLDRIIQGTGESERDGRDIHLNSVVMRCILASQDSTNMVRIMVIQTTNSTENNSTFPSGVLDKIAGDSDASLLDTTTNNEYLLWLYARNSPVQFKVLYDRIHVVANNNGLDLVGGALSKSQQAPPLKRINLKFSKGFLNGGKVEYSEAGGVINPTSGDIFICVESDSVPATSHPQLYVNYRVTYTSV